jgi:hypothetical protein
MSGPSPTEIGAIVSQALRSLVENGFSIADPVLEAANADSLDSAISMFSGFLKLFSSANFHPIAAQTTRILAFLMRAAGSVQPFLEYSLDCLSPVYSRHFSEDVQRAILATLLEAPSTQLVVSDPSKSPFDIAIGFVNSGTLPSQEVEVVFRIRALLLKPVTVRRVAVSIAHSQAAAIEFDALGEVEIPNVRVLKHSHFLKIDRPGTIKIGRVVVQFGNILLSLATFRDLGYATSSILPLDAECQFSVRKLDFGITSVPYAINILCDRIPRGADKFSFAVRVDGNTEIVKLMTSRDPPAFSEDSTFAESVDAPQSSLERTLHLFAAERTEVTVNVVWSLSYETVIRNHEESFNVRFVSPFKVTFKMFNPDRSPLPLKKPPLIAPSEQYILIATFEYHLPIDCSIQELRNAPIRGVDLQPVPFDLPLELAPNEAFTTACFLRAGLNVDTKPIGRIDVNYRVKGHDQLVAYSIQMPTVEFVQRKCEVNLVAPEVLELNKQACLRLAIRGMIEPGLDCEVRIGESYYFLMQTDVKQQIRLPFGETVNFEVPFTAIRPGKLAFPQITIICADGPAWASAPLSFVVKAE